MASMRFLAGAAIAALSAAALAQVATPPPAPQAAPAPPPAKMSFFVTSVGVGDGGNLGGLAGADAHCTKLAATAGRGDVKWVAYLSTQGAGAVHARDRIGAGPWHNAKGQLIGRSVGDLHGDTIEQARAGVILGRSFTLDEQGRQVNGVGDSPNRHDILTGSGTDGRGFPAGADKTCSNWTSNDAGSAQVGHHDKQGGGGGSWNSQHASRSCSQSGFVATGGAGLLYCFVPG